MQRISTPSAVSGQFAEQTGTQQKTIVSPEWLTAIQEEIANVVEAAGLSLDKADAGQLDPAVATVGALALDDLVGVHESFLAPSGGTTTGEGYIVGNVFVMALQTKLEGEAFLGTRIGNVTLPKNTSEGFNPGQRIYWDPVGGECSRNSADGRVLIGYAKELEGAADPTASIHLDGAARSAVSVDVGFQPESTNPSVHDGFRTHYYRSTEGTVTLTIERIGDSPTTEVEVAFEVDAASTAIDGTHYDTLTASPVTIAAGNPTASISFAILSDGVFRKEALLRLNLLSVSPDGTIPAESATFDSYISPADAVVVPAADFNLAGPIDHDEDAGPLALTVDLTAASGSDSLLHFKPNASSTAVLGSDYTLEASPKLVTAGATSTTVTITPINGALSGDKTVVLDIEHETTATRRNLLSHSDFLLPSRAYLDSKTSPGQPTAWIGGCYNPSPGYTLDFERDGTVDVPTGGGVDATLVTPWVDAGGIGCLKPAFDSGEYCGAPSKLPSVAEGKKIVHWGFVHRAGNVSKRFDIFRVAIMDRTRQVDDGTGAAFADFEWPSGTGAPVLLASGNGGVGKVEDATMEFADGHADYLGNGWFPVSVTYTVEASALGDHRCTWFWNPVSPAYGSWPADVGKGSCWWRPQFEADPAGGVLSLPNQEVLGNVWQPKGGLRVGTNASITVTLKDV